MRSADIVFNWTAWRFEIDALPAVRFRHIPGAQLFLQKASDQQQRQKMLWLWRDSRNSQGELHAKHERTTGSQKHGLHAARPNFKHSARTRSLRCCECTWKADRKTRYRCKKFGKPKCTSHLRRGFTIRLKGLSLGSPGFRGPQIFGCKDNFQHFVRNYIYIFLLVQRTFFTMPLRKDLCRTGVPNLCLTMHPFSISIDEHLPLKFLWQKSLIKLQKSAEFLKNFQIFRTTTLNSIFVSQS